ncbi:MAG: hypothetical protein AAF230_10100 [Pseudomonadota bacterium]
MRTPFPSITDNATRLPLSEMRPEASTPTDIVAPPLSFGDVILNLRIYPALDPLPAAGTFRLDMMELMGVVGLLAAALFAAQLMPTRRQRAALLARYSARAAAAISRMR